MTHIKLCLAASLLAALAAVGCSSSGSGSPGSTSSGVFCELTIATAQTCGGSTSYTASQQSQAKSACTQQGGTVVSSCPTSGLVGCCTAKVSGNISQETCTYLPGGDAGSMVDAGAMQSSAKTGCENQGGTWSTSP